MAPSAEHGSWLNLHAASLLCVQICSEPLLIAPPGRSGPPSSDRLADFDEQLEVLSVWHQQEALHAP